MEILYELVTVIKMSGIRKSRSEAVAKPVSLGNREDLRCIKAVSQETCQTLYRSMFMLRATSNWLYALINPL